MTDHHGMMTTPRRNDAGGRSDDRGRDRSFTHNRTHWSAPRAVSPRQVDEIKRQLRSGVYDTPQMLDALARRLIDSGEL
ncbi:MAG TPA: hypothetical protein VJR24_17130 [Gemmatimonadaceae bacterium]|nr:hypothetical protein [Gemmatimonadaceae bacterium]